MQGARRVCVAAPEHAGQDLLQGQPPRAVKPWLDPCAPRPCAPELAPGHRVSRPRGTGSVGDSVGSGGCACCATWVLWAVACVSCVSCVCTLHVSLSCSVGSCAVGSCSVLSCCVTVGAHKALLRARCPAMYRMLRPASQAGPQFARMHGRGGGVVADSGGAEGLGDTKTEAVAEAEAVDEVHLSEVSLLPFPLLFLEPFPVSEEEPFPVSICLRLSPSALFRGVA